MPTGPSLVPLPLPCRCPQVPAWQGRVLLALALFTAVSAAVSLACKVAVAVSYTDASRKQIVTALQVGPCVLRRRAGGCVCGAVGCACWCMDASRKQIVTIRCG